MRLSMRRSPVTLLFSASVFALFLAVTAPASFALDSSDCEDGSCPTGTLPTESPSTVGDNVEDNESDQGSEQGGFDDDDSESPESGQSGEGGTPG